MLFSQTIFYPKRVQKRFIDFNSIVTKACFTIVKSDTDLRALNNPRFRNFLQLDNFVVIGTGGSCLGGKTICSAAKKDNIQFVENIDATALSELFSKDLSRTGFLCISKSGETLETIYATLLLISKENNLKDRVVVITENKNSTLHQIAHEYDFMCFEHPSNIGGRYSVFSIVGMIPALICGFEPKKIRLGANRILEDFANAIYKVQEGAGFVLNSLEDQRSTHVSFIYSDKMRYFGHWLAQLYAESSGKNGKGVTPITAIGAVDQHSQLQLYMDGPRDKRYTFFFENQSDGISLSGVEIPKNFAYLDGISANSVLKSQYQATYTALKDNDNFVRLIEFPTINPESLGALFMHFMLEVVAVCQTLEVNAFDQPAVEKGKNIARELLESSHDAF